MSELKPYDGNMFNTVEGMEPVEGLPIRIVRMTTTYGIDIRIDNDGRVWHGLNCNCGCRTTSGTGEPI